MPKAMPPLFLRRLADRRRELYELRHASAKKTGTRPVTPWEMSKRVSNPDWLHKHGLRHEPTWGGNAPVAPKRVHRQFRVLRGGYQGPRKHHRVLIVAWERALLCIQCKQPIQTTAVRGVYEGRQGLIHKHHLT